MAPRLAVLALGAACMLSGLDAALLRLGVWAPVGGEGASLSARLWALHGPLMLVGFLSTLIALERAVAARRAWAYLAPVGSATGCLSLLLGAPAPLGRGLALVGALVLLAVYHRVHRRAPAVAVDVEALGAVALVLGNLVWFLTPDDVTAAVPFWLLLPTLTIIGERLELARVAFVDEVVERTVQALALAALLGVCLLGVLEAAHIVAGAALLGLAVVLSWYDVARRTVRARGPEMAGVRFMAASMLAGYVWLAVSGATWTLASLRGGGGPAYETVVHGLALGFAFSMILAHAPTIIPAIIHRRLPYHRAMWLPYALLHAGLAVRVAGLAADAVTPWQAGGVLGVVAVLTFLAIAATRVLTGGALATGRGAGRATGRGKSLGGDRGESRGEDQSEGRGAERPAETAQVAPPMAGAETTS